MYRETCRSLLEDTRRKHPGESQLWRYRETCRGNVDYRIPGIPHSTVLKEDANRKDTVKRLIQQFENHPKRNSLIQDLNKTEEVNPFSEKSKELITDMGKTSSSFARPLLRYNALIALYIGEVGIIHCTCGKCLQPTERNRQLNKDRFDVLSILGYLTKKNPTDRVLQST